LFPLVRLRQVLKPTPFCYDVLKDVTSCYLLLMNGLLRGWTHHFKWVLCIGICVPCLGIRDIALGNAMLHWDSCTLRWPYLQTLGSMTFALGSMYRIEICVTALGSVTVHQAMMGMPCHHTCHMDHLYASPIPTKFSP
jgi:hypothetical protein